MRQCPTPEGGPALPPLIAHRISACDCEQRQQEHYHKCHRCVFRGKPVDFVLADTNGVHRSGLVAREDQLEIEQIVELPTRNGSTVAAQVEPTKS